MQQSSEHSRHASHHVDRDPPVLPKDDLLLQCLQSRRKEDSVGADEGTETTRRPSGPGSQRVFKSSGEYDNDGVLILVIEENRLWFVKLKEYLLQRYEKVKKTVIGIGTTARASLLDLPDPPTIEVHILSSYSARIVITNTEENANQEEKYVVRYRTDPPVSPAMSRDP